MTAVPQPGPLSSGATPAQWLEGARPRTWPAAISPVLAGSGAAFLAAGFSWPRAVLALVVSLALQIGVNYANDYSDGVRGTDAKRIGPLRLVGSGLARPATVKAAAFACFGVAGVAGLVLVVLSAQWWLLAVGVASVAAAWFYTGGQRPYGYAGLGELFVFVFFGLIATCGTKLVQVGRITLPSVFSAVALGAICCAILVANNLRDIEGDTAAGKRTLATRLGDRGTRFFYAGLLRLALVAVVFMAAISTPWALLGLIVVPVIAPAAVRVQRGAVGRDLIAVLKATGTAELALAVGLTVGFVIATR
ncbi:MAG: 1,4-dihydroxy-2-naphthoate polyprenyltransferase [Propionibacteriaceae bacterium]